MKTLTLECPSCQHQFSPDASLQQHVQHLLQYQQSAMQQDFATKEEQLRKFQSKLKQQALEAETLINQQVETRAATLRQELQAQLKQDHADELRALRTELAEKNEIARTVKNKEIELEQLRRAVDQVEADVTLRYERQLTAQQQAIEQRVRQQTEEKYTLQLAEVNKRLSDTRHQLTEAQRKAEQGSTQLQGEVQEQYIEDKLRELFPCDTVQEVAKGVSGADVLQTVRNELHQASGTILYESKRTKAFGKDWISKLRSDQQRAGASAAILVTQQMPPEVEEEYCIIENVAVCSFRVFPMVAMLLRHQVMALHGEQLRHVNRADKMNQLYDYLTSQEFRMHLEGLVRCFSEMRQGVDKERRSWESQWKQREKQLEALMVHTAGIYGSVRQIAGGAVKEISLLELPV